MCIVCRHNQIKDIDRALLTGSTLTSLNQKYGFSTSALQRHQEHLMQKMARAQRLHRLQYWLILYKMGKKKTEQMRQMSQMWRKTGIGSGNGRARGTAPKNECPDIIIFRCGEPQVNSVGF